MREISDDLRDRFLGSLAEIEVSRDQFIVMPPAWEIVARRA